MGTHGLGTVRDYRVGNGMKCCGTPACISDSVHILTSTATPDFLFKKK
jgi:hypothetical protein